MLFLTFIHFSFLLWALIFHWVLYILITECFSSCQVVKVQGKSWAVKIQDASKPVPKLLFNYSSGWPLTTYLLDPSVFNHRKSDLILNWAVYPICGFKLILCLMCKCYIPLWSDTGSPFLFYIYLEKSQKPEMRPFTQKILLIKKKFICETFHLLIHVILDYGQASY